MIVNVKNAQMGITIIKMDYVMKMKQMYQLFVANMMILEIVLAKKVFIT